MFNLHTQKFEVLEYKLNVKKLQNKQRLYKTLKNNTLFLNDNKLDVFVLYLLKIKF